MDRWLHLKKCEIRCTIVFVIIAFYWLHVVHIFNHYARRIHAKKRHLLPDNVACTDLQLVLKYMYKGSGRLKNDDLQGLGELLEMFLMSLPGVMSEFLFHFIQFILPPSLST